MRIIAGKYRGKPLLSPSNKKVRPTGDMVKQGLFTKLQFFVEGKKVLDLFSGSGALGIEAISRGAKKVVFVDKDWESIALTKRNLASINEKALVLKCDYTAAIKKLDENFDLILVDPPYASGVYDDCLEKIKQKNMLTNDGIIVCEHDKSVQISNKYFDVVDQKHYGTVYLTYLKNKV